MASSIRWTKKIPVAGWHWCRYRGKDGWLRVPCEVYVMVGGMSLIRTARNDSFMSCIPASMKDVTFGPPIVLPKAA